MELELEMNQTRNIIPIMMSLRNKMSELMKKVEYCM